MLKKVVLLSVVLLFVVQLSGQNLTSDLYRVANGNLPPIESSEDDPLDFSKINARDNFDNYKNPISNVKKWLQILPYSKEGKPLPGKMFEAMIGEDQLIELDNIKVAKIVKNKVYLLHPNFQNTVKNPKFSAPNSETTIEETDAAYFDFVVKVVANDGAKASVTKVGQYKNPALLSPGDNVTTMYAAIHVKDITPPGLDLKFSAANSETTVKVREEVPYVNKVSWEKVFKVDIKGINMIKNVNDQIGYTLPMKSKNNNIFTIANGTACNDPNFRKYLTFLEKERVHITIKSGDNSLFSPAVTWKIIENEVNGGTETFVKYWGIPKVDPTICVFEKLNNQKRKLYLNVVSTDRKNNITNLTFPIKISNTQMKINSINRN